MEIPVQMKRYIYVVVLALLAVVPLSAQAPAGWKMRVDRSMNASDPDAPGPIKFVVHESGFHATNPQAASTGTRQIRSPGITR